MSQEIEDRLVAMAEQASARFGPSVLKDRARLSEALQSEAPELRLHIKALAGALSTGVGDAAALAAQENVDLASAQSGLKAAGRIGSAPAAAPAAPPQPNAPASDDWVGDSMAVGAAPAPAPSPAPPAPAPAPPPPQGTTATGAQEPFYKNKWVIIAAVAALGFYFYSQQNSQQQPPQQQRPQAGGGGGQQRPGGGGGVPPGPGGGGGQRGGGQQAGGTIPMLAPPGGQLPAVPMQFQQGNAFMSFAMPTANGQLYGMVTVQGGQLSSGGMIGFTNNPQSGQMQTLSQPGMFQLGNNGNYIGRVLQPVWQYDQLGVKEICVVFEQQGGQDVQLNGSALCIYNSGCQQAIACGQVRG